MRSVFLVGFMGSGKSTVGRLLAERMHLPFADLDEEIERLEGAAVAEIFEREGELAFRAAERRALAIQVGRSPAVVATGGGLFIEESNRRCIAMAGGCAVFLHVPWWVIAHRIGAIDANRPLWQDPEAARRLYEERLPTYLLADVVIPTSGNETSAEVAEMVLHDLVEVPCAI